METKLIRSAHAVGESNYHLQLTPAYRRDLFADPLVRELTLGYIAQKLAQFKVALLGYGFGPDHLHSSSATCATSGKSRSCSSLRATAAT